jgi:hypothetical protein
VRGLRVPRTCLRNVRTGLGGDQPESEKAFGEAETGPADRPILLSRPRLKASQRLASFPQSAQRTVSHGDWVVELEGIKPIARHAVTANWSLDEHMTDR